MQTSKYIKQYWIGNYKYLLPLAIFTFLFLFLYSELSPLYPINDWPDVSLYLTIGKAIFQGKVLYTEIFDHKGPLIFFIYGFSALFKPLPFLMVFILQFLLWYITLIAIFKLGESLLIPKTITLLVVILVLPFSLNFMYKGGSPEEFILLVNAISLVLFIEYFRAKDKKHNPKYMIIHGFNSAFILFLKLNLTIFMLIMLIALAISIIKFEGIKGIIKNALYYLLGFAIITLPMLAYFIWNNNLKSAFDIYVILNKASVAHLPLDKILTDGFFRVTLLFKDTPFSFFLMFIGGLVFPCMFIKNKVGKIALYLAMLPLFAMIFFTGIFHMYYPLPLCMIIVLGLLTCGRVIQSVIHISYSKLLITSVCFIALLQGYYETKLFNIGFNGFLTRSSISGQNYYFASSLQKEKHPTLLNLAYGASNSIFTICDIVPNIKYFIAVNLNHDVYPEMRNEQLTYLRNKKCQFVIVREDNEFFTKSHELLDNYDLIDSYDEYLLYLKPPVRETFLLYKAKP